MPHVHCLFFYLGGTLLELWFIWIALNNMWGFTLLQFLFRWLSHGTFSIASWWHCILFCPKIQLKHRHTNLIISSLKAEVQELHSYWYIGRQQRFFRLKLNVKCIRIHAIHRKAEFWDLVELSDTIQLHKHWLCFSTECRNCVRCWEHPGDKVTVSAIKKLTDFLILCQLAMITFSSKEPQRNVLWIKPWSSTEHNSTISKWWLRPDCVTQVLFAKLKALSTYINL